MPGPASVIAPTSEVTGLVRIEDRAKGRVWIAEYRRADRKKVRKTLGLAWVRDSGARTPRGAIVWRAGAGPKPADHYLTPKEAELALEDLLHEERRRPRREVERQGRKTIEDVIAAWLEHSRTVKGVTPATYRSYESVGKSLREALGPRTLARSLSVSDVKRLQREMLDAERARATVHHQLTSLRRALEIAFKAGWIDGNIADEVEIVPLPKVEPDFNVLEPSQVEVVADAIATVPESELPRMRNGEVWEDVAGKVRTTRLLWSEVIRIAAYTGLRIGELRALWWVDVDWSGAALRVARNAPVTAPVDNTPKAPKSGKARSVPLIPQALDSLRRVSHLGHATGPGDLVFPSLGGGLFDGGRVRTAFYEGLEAAGFEHLRTKPNPMTFHDLRHTFGTIAARVFPLADVQAYLGHSDISTTMRYAHHVPRTDAARLLATGFASDRGNR